MLTCDQCRAALLDRQYGLLDPAAAAALDAHLAGCPACQVELLKAERFGRLLATAARAEFPDVRFVAPSDPATPVGDAASAGRPRTWTVWSVTGWMAAAAVLAGISIPTAA